MYDELTAEERQLARQLEQARRDYLSAKGDQIDYSIPVLADKTIWNSRLYQLCKTMPKGGDLHVHGLALLPVRELIEFLRNRQDVVIGVSGDNIHKVYLADDRSRPHDCMNLGQALEQGVLTQEALLFHWSVRGRAHRERAWDYLEELFVKDDAISANPALLRDYYDTAFRYYCSLNIQYVEIRPLFFGTEEIAARKAASIRQAYYDVRRDFPDFRARLIGAGLKTLHAEKSLTEKLMNNNVYIHANVKDEFDKDNVSDFLVGLDLVNEEDNSHPLSFFADMLTDIKKEHPDLHLVLHAGESLAPENNSVETAMQLHADRIGHGFNMYRFPETAQWCKDNQVCVEACLISNNALGYCADLRGHPALGYIRQGIPVVLGSDDPCYLEHTSLVDDFFAAIVCWNLPLEAVKQLCRNSLAYSIADPDTKAAALQSWQTAWEEWVKREGV